MLTTPGWLRSLERLLGAPAAARWVLINQRRPSQRGVTYLVLRANSQHFITKPDAARHIADAADLGYSSASNHSG